MRKPGRRLKMVGKGLLVLATVCAVFLWGANRAVLASAEGRIFADVSTAPAQPVVLVLGTSPLVRGGKNLYFERRMDATASLYHAGKAAKILLSGDKSGPHYNEPLAMKQALVSRGVPEKVISMDYAGFSTHDSIVRAHRVFGVTTCTIVSNDFHLPRALYIAKHEGLECVGFQGEPLGRKHSTSMQVREFRCRLQAWIDLHVLNRQPKSKRA